VEEEMTLDLRDLFYIIRKRMKIIVLITLICTILSAGVSYFVLKPVYESQTSIIVGRPQGDEQNLSSDVTLYQKLIQTYIEIAKSNLVAEEAVGRLEGRYSVGQVQGAIAITPQSNTQIIIIKAQSEFPGEAVQIVTAVTNSFIDKAKTVFPTGGDIQIMDRAEIPVSPVKPNKKLNVAIAFLIGLMGSMGLVFVLEYLDRTIKSEDDVAKYLDIPVIGIIPKEHTDNSERRRNDDRYTQPYPSGDRRWSKES
jgi:capsular polysaccharide biosynthesis protein